MAFDFDTPVERRHTGSLKWDKYADPWVLPMWVADMDFRAPPQLIAALHARIDQGVFGYTRATAADQEAVMSMLERRYGWRVAAESIVWLPGVVPGLLAASRAVGAPGDGIICHTPIYHHFLEVAQQAGRRRLDVPLLLDDGRYTYDLESTERVCSLGASSIQLCHPHNPVGTAFRPEDLSPLLALCERHKLVVVSDEIHCDLVLESGCSHTPVAMLAPDGLQTITLMSPSKTYNLAGLNCSFAIIRDRELRRAFVEELRNASSISSPLAFTAMRTVYDQCDGWRRELVAYLRGNRDLLEAAVEGMPGIAMNHVEATYLGWIDVSRLQVPSAAGLFEQHGVGLSGGAQFGDDRYVRINFGCPRRQLEEALGRMELALSTL